MQHSFPHAYILGRKYQRDKRKIKYPAHFNLKMTTVVSRPHHSPPLNRFWYFSNRLSVLIMRRLKNADKGKANLTKHKGATAALPAASQQTQCPFPRTPDPLKKASHFPATRVSSWHYLHGPTVGFNVNHISSFYSLFLQTFKNAGVQLKKTNKQ